jgi:dihydrofolate reductase
MRKIVSFVHVSLDGFVASTAEGPAGLAWISVSPDLFEYVEQRIQQTDTSLYGRKTYQMMESYWPTAADKPDASPHDHAHSRWYKSAHKVMLSKTLLAKKITLIRKLGLREKLWVKVAQVLIKVPEACKSKP